MKGRNLSSTKCTVGADKLGSGPVYHKQCKNGVIKLMNEMLSCLHILKQSKLKFTFLLHFLVVKLVLRKHSIEDYKEGLNKRCTRVNLYYSHFSLMGFLIEMFILITW